MVDFKIVLSEPKTGKSYKIDATGAMASALVGRRIGEEIPGDALGLAGYSVVLTGGSDRTGIPARRDLPGMMRRRLLLSEGTGFNAVSRGQRRRKSIRGNEITADFVQINAKVTGYGAKDLNSIFGGEKSEEATSAE